MVCQECGVNTALMQGHSRICSRYEEPALSEEEQDELLGIPTEASTKMHDFGEAVNDAVISRGEKSIIAYLSRVGITEKDPGYEDILILAHMCLTVGAGVAVQIMIEQDIVDQDGLLRAAGV
jgi:hypothetical protein